MQGMNRTAYGFQSLRRYWRKRLCERCDESETMSYPIVMYGVSHAVYVFASLFGNSKTRVVVPDLLYERYGRIFGLRGCHTASYPFFTYASLGEEGVHCDIKVQFNLQGMFKEVCNCKDALDKVIVVLELGGEGVVRATKV